MSTTKPSLSDVQEMTGKQLKALAKELGISYSDVEPVESSSSTPVVADWRRAVTECLAGGGEKVPTQQEIIREGLAEGLSNQEITEAVLAANLDSSIKPEHVSWTLGNERRKGTDWWIENRQAIADARGRQVRAYVTPEEDAEGLTNEDVVDLPEPEEDEDA